jgi:hypothetical protein
MKQIIDGKLYDTKKSKLVSKRNDEYIKYAIYKSKKGAYFALTQYPYDLPKMTYDSEPGFLTLVNTDFMRVILAMFDTDAYQKEFGEVEEA